MFTPLRCLTKLCTVFIVSLAFPGLTQAQTSVTTPQVAYPQDFNSMGTSTTFAPHWIGVKAAGSSTTVVNGATLTLVVTNGGANSGAIYNVGTTAEDRAFGSLASAGIIPRFGTSFQNNTGQTITSIDLKGVMEQWRSGSISTVNEVLTFEYSLDATSLTDGTWMPLSTFDLVEKLTATTVAAAVNGNDEANKTNLNAQLTLSWPANATLWIRWTDKDDTGSDGIYALDDFELTAHTGGVTPVDNIAPALAANPFTPADNAAGVSLSTSLSVTFNENVKTGTGNIILYNVTDGTSQEISVANQAAVAINGATVTLPGAVLNYEKEYAVQFPAGTITDLAGNAFAGFTDRTSWNFASVASPVVDNGTTLHNLDVAYTQNFDGMGTAGTSLPTNWFAVRAGGTGTAGQPLNPVVNNGSGSSGAIYNVGTGGSSDRAISTLSSGSTIPAFGASFTNNTGKIITSLDVKGVLEQWRSASNSTINETVVFEYSFNATSLTSGTWIKFSQLDLQEILTETASAAAVDGNVNQANLSGTITNIGWRVGTNLWIRWTDADDTGSDGMYALDNFELTAHAVPDVTAPTLSATNPFQPQASETQVDHEASLVISFSEIMQPGTGVILVKNLTDNTQQNISLSEVTIQDTKVTFPASLLPAKTYEVSIPAGVFKDLADNDFTGIPAGSWTFTTAVFNPYAQNFNRCETLLPGGWTQFSAQGATEVWACSTFGRNGNGVQVNGYNGGNKLNEDWLISPAYDLATGFNYPLLSFWSRTRFAGESLKLLVSTNYSGSGDPAAATWKEINGAFPVLDSDVWTPSKDINLFNFKGKTVYIAFVYASSTESAARWTLDDVAITNSEMAPAPAAVFFKSTLTPISNFDFGFVNVQDPTAAKSFSFYALDLRTDLTLTAPAQFELSKNGSAYAATLTYTPAEAFADNTVYVRFRNNAPTLGSFSGAIQFSSQNFNKQGNYLTATTLPKEKTFDVVTWNIEWFGHASLGPAIDTLQLANAKKLLLEQDAELITVEEIVNEEAFNNLVSELPGYKGFLSPYVSGSSGPNAQKVGFIYKSSAVEFVSARGMLVNPANSTSFWASGRLPYLFVADVTQEGVKKRMHFIAIHTKANENTSAADALDAYTRRLSDLKVLKDTLDTYYAEANIMMMGDYNDDVDFTVANVSTTESTYKPFIDDADRYRAVTKDLSEAGLRTYITFDNVIDHVMISDELYADYVPGSAKVVIPFDMITDYGSTTSDHMPVTARFILTPNVSFAAAASTIAEDAGTYNLTLNLTRASATPQILTITVAPGAGVTDAEYNAPDGDIYTVTVPAGATKATLPILIQDDQLVELDETLAFTLTNASKGLGFNSAETFTLTLLDNDASEVTFSTPTTTLEEQAGAYAIQLTLDQAPVTDQVLTITPQNASSAQYGLDYTTAPATIGNTISVTVPTGATTATFALQVQDDYLVESTEQIIYTVSTSSSKVKVGTASTFQTTINDNDKSTLNFALSTATVSENAGSYQVNLTLDQVPVVAQTIVISLTNTNGAVYGTEKGQYTTKPAAVNNQITLTIPAGQTKASFVVVINNYTKTEANKTITFQVAQVSTGLVSGITSAFTLTIQDASNPEVKGPSSTEAITIAPNPSHSEVTLIFENSAVNTATDLNLTLWNSQGYNILTVKGNLTNITQKLNQKLTQVQKGIYVLKVVSGSTLYQTKLIRD